MYTSKDLVPNVGGGNFLAEIWLGLIKQKPILTLISCLLPVVIMVSGIRGVVKDPSVDAFVSLEHPAAKAREQARELFGLEDPMVVAFVAEEGGTMYTPERLASIEAFSNAVTSITDVNPNGVISIATESVIRGEQGDLFVDPIIEKVDGAINADLAWQRVQTMPPLMGTLSAVDGSALMVIVPVENPNSAEQAFSEIQILAKELSPKGVKPHVAGVAAMNARLSEIVNADTKKFVPGALIVVLLSVFLALRNLKSVLASMVVIAGSAGAAIGLMGWVGAKYYLITTSLPVILMAIAVADSIHLLVDYFDRRKKDGSLTIPQATSEAVRAKALPITLTSLTTALGFIGLSLGTDMKPISDFGLFAAAGICVAWFLSLTVLPALIILLKIEPRDAAGSVVISQELSPSWLDRLLLRVSQICASRSAGALCAIVLITGFLLVFAFQSRFDYQRKDYFRSNDEVRIADATINERFAGSNFLDIVVSAPEASSLLKASAIKDIASLEESLAAVSHVQKVTGISDYIAIMHERLMGADNQKLPTKENAPAQYMLLYESSGDPGDFDEEIDYDYQNALIRTQINIDNFSTLKVAVDQFEEIAAQWSKVTGLEARVSGRIAVNDGWMTALTQSHRVSLGFAVIFVFIVSMILFKAVRPAIITLVPVLSGIILVYGMMGLLNINIAPATSMCAAIAAGLGVDFGIHLMQQVRANLREGKPVLDAIDEKFSLVAKANWFSALSLVAGFSIITMSSVPALQWFGILVSSATIGSLLGALLVVPALSVYLYREEEQVA